MDIRPSTSKSFVVNDFSKAPLHKTPTLTDDKSNFGLKRSGTISSAKRSRISVDDYHSNFSDNTTTEVNSNSETKTNDGILRRVSNTVSGLFSNSSWSEWLKGPSPLAISNDRQDSFFNSSDTLNSSETKNETRLIQLYPEEGISETIDKNEVAGLSASQPVSIENSWAPLKNIIPPFKEDHSFISSTPALSSPYLSKRGKDDLLGDPVLLKPSTSNFHSELLPPRDDSVTLKHSFSEALADNHSSHTNGSISTYPTSRKRLRESMEGESNTEDINASVSKKRSLTQSQIFSEDNEESMTRKRPRFSISTYGSPLWNKPPEDEPSFSIFYPGKIMYGGASNHHRKRNRIIPRKICPRTPATISRNDDDHSDGGLSSAARRILDCIDKISTPLSDSKRAFQFCSPRDFSFNSSSFVADFHKNRPTAKLNTLTTKNSPPVNKLLTPSKVKITKNFSSLFSSKSNEVEASVNDANYEKKHKEINSDKNDSSAKMISQKSSTSIVAKETASNQESNKNSSIRQNSHFASYNRVSKSSSSTYDSSTASNSIFKADVQKFNKINDQKHDLVTFTKGKENILFGGKSTAFDNVDYKFSNPAVVSDLSLLENLPKNSIEFKFSQPINEEELSSSKECFISDSKESSFIIKKNKWNCDTCLLQNEESNIKCAACEAPKPQKAKVPETSLAVSQNFGCAFKKPEGSWECETCLLQNKSDQEKCVACFTAKPIKELKSQDSASDKKLLSFSGNWGESSKRPEGSWDCPKCLLQNKTTFNVCASCEAPKPSQRNSGVSSSSKTSLNNWGEAFKPSEGSWVCESCLVQNTSNYSNCLCCKAAKPKIEKENKIKSSTEISPFCFETSKNKTTTKHQDDVKEKENLWICPECLITNNNLEEKCLSCKCSRPTPSNILPKDSKSSLTGSFPSQFLKGKDEWECETCCVRNKNTKQKCQSCDTPRARLSHSDIVSEALTGNFKFDSNPKPKPNDSSSTFKFGIASDATKGNLSGFSFGVNPVLSKNEKPSATKEEIEKSSVFNFGNNTALPMEENPRNSNLDANSSKDVKAGFKFGVNSSKDVSVSLEGNSSNDIKSDAITFGADATSSKNEKLSMPNAEVNKGSTKAVTTSSFSFGDHISKTPGFSLGADSNVNKNDSGNIQLSNPSKASNIENSVTSSTLTLQPSTKEPSKSITFDLEEVKSNKENTVDKPATSSVLQVPIESKTSSSTLQPPTSITNPSGALSSSNLIFGVTPASAVSSASPKNASDSVSTTTTSTTSFSFFKPSVSSLTTKLEETANNKQESKSKPIFQFGSSNITQSSGTKFEFPKLDNSGVKNPNDFFSQGFPKVNPSSFNFLGNSSSAQSVDNKPSVPSFGDAKPAPTFGDSKLPPSFGDSKPLPSFGDSKPPPSFGDPKSLFVFGNNDVKPQNTGFSFGKPETSKVTSTAPVFGGFVSPVSQPFKFTQQEPSPMMQTMHKSSETAAPSSFSFDPRQNPFNAAPSLGDQKAPRITKRAHRRLLHKN